ncbi:MAG: phosphoglyceromutase [Acidimicrobiales bacterium]|nr:phosphoglyceromutase [Acidimicrobiales bacterium]
MPSLILMRHGQSTWNLENLFTGWVDVDLTDQGRDEARAGGAALREAGLAPDVVHTSLQLRAIRTANLALEELGRLWVPVRRHWRLNERHYGGLTGLDKKETADRYGEEQVHIWRRSYDIPPPPMEADSAYHPSLDARYADLAPDLIPATECLKDVVVRMLPYWYDAIVPDLRAGRTVLVAAHGNSLRALVMHLDGIAEAEIPELNLPTGVPILYELGDDLRPQQQRHPLDRVVGDPEAARAAAAAVAAQASGR